MPAAPDAVKCLVFAALEREPGERAAFLDSACRGDDDLRRRVEALLRAGEAADSLLDRPAAWHLDVSPTPPPQGTPLPAAAADLEVSALTLAGSFRLLGEIARGGMGAVLRAYDPEMDRVLAVKVVLPQYRNDPAMTRRFLGEARLAGQLQHPGVVPVHDVGRLPDGRPFFAMKLIEGRTLAQLLRERPGPGHDLPRFLRYFEAVCQAIGYAHGRGVIHRDLKPGNVMVGAFGEVQVMDWGLAKVLGKEEQGQAADSDSSFIPHPLSFPATLPGRVAGTPAYAAPELASGAAERLDERSDVFGLGAVLCEVLTGQPPYVGADPVQVHRLAARAELADARARLNGCGADAELVRLALACLAPRPADRPRDARAVAEALTAYLDGVQARLRAAELAEAEARARAAGEAKRRRLALALAGTVLLAVTLGGGGGLWLQADRQARQARLQARQTELTREVNDVLRQVVALREKARTAADGAAWFAQARERVQRALALVQAGPADEVLTAEVRRVQGELDEEEKDRQFIGAVEAAFLAQGQTVSGRSRYAFERAVPLLLEAFRAYGLAVGEGDPAAARLRERPPQVREAFGAALDELIVQATDSRYLPKAIEPRYQLSEPQLAWLRALATTLPEEGLAREMLAAWQEQDPGKRRAALERMAEEVDVRQVPPPALTRLERQLAAVQSTTSRSRLLFPGDVQFLEDRAAAVPSTASRLRLLRRAQQQYPGDFWLNLDLGMCLAETEPARWAEAVRYVTAAVALRPSTPGVRSDLGHALQAGFQLDEAIACYRQAIALDPNHFRAHYNLGSALLTKNQVDEAIASFRQAIALDPQFALAHFNLGTALDARGQGDEAIACYRQAIALDPRHAAVYYNLGNALRSRGQLDEAIASFRQAVAVNPKFALAHNNLGNVLRSRGQLDEAIACIRQAIVLDPKFTKAYNNLGYALQSKGQLDEAIASYRQAIALDPRYFLAHDNLTVALKAKGQGDEAVAGTRRALALAPNNAGAHNSLGFALKENGQVDEAIACFRKAIALDPKLADAHNNLGDALTAKGQLDEAIACIRQSLALDPKDSSAHHNLGTALKGKGQLDGAIASYRKAIELAPDSADAHCDLGHALQARGDFAEALAAFRRGHELGGQRADWKKPSAQWVGDCEQLVEREKQLLDILGGKSNPADAKARLAWAGLCVQTRRYAAAVRLWGEAFEAEAQLADDLKAGSRWQAAAAAARAAAGRDRDAGGLDNAQQARLRQRALTWLKADLAARASQPAGERAAVLRRWQTDERLAGVRGEPALRALPEAERAAWVAFWSAVQRGLLDGGSP
jgi:serine/threonine-protein kinase